jgi:hypothetical protein
MYDNLQKFVVFVGPRRTGSTLVGAMLDAHPHAVIANEIPAFRWSSYPRDFIITQILKTSERYARYRNPGGGGYLYSVPNSSQGTYREPLQVVGTKESVETTRKMISRPAKLGLYLEKLGCEPKLFLCVRNPYDAVTTEALRSNINLDCAIRQFNDLMQGYADIAEMYDVHVVKSEDMITDTEAQIRAVLDYVGLGDTAGYVRNCASIVSASPHVTRHDGGNHPYYTWTDSRIDALSEIISEHRVLDGYAY